VSGLISACLCAGQFWCPHAVIAEHRVGDYDQFPHDGDNGDLGGFAGLAQSAVFRLQTVD
jgi:hypothetical protein